MRARAAALLLVLSLFAAGCTAPDESADPTPSDATVDATPTPPAPTPASPTPELEITGVTSWTTSEGPPAPAAPTPAPTPSAPAPEPAPAPVAPPPAAPSPPPEPSATPPPSPQPSPQPSPPPSPQPTPSPSPQPTPQPSPSPQPPSWPREGSYVRYEARTGQAFAGSDQSRVVYANLSWTYTNGDWRGECVAQVHDDMDGDGNVTVSEVRQTYSASSPPHWPLLNTRDPPAVGERVETWWADGCTLEHDTWTYVGIVDGAHRAQSTQEDMPYDFATTWDPDSGVVLRWSLAKAGSSAPRSESGRLVATDAP